MALEQFMFDIVERERTKAEVIQDPEVIKLALNIAYYGAIINVAIDDPLNDPDEHAEVLAFLNAENTKFIEEYQKKSNKYF